MAKTIDLGNVKGPQGAKGEAGDRGPQGIQGVAGPQGLTGPAGTTTWAGITGKPGTFPPSTHAHSETQITSGWQQSISQDGGYRKLPGGVILQFGTYVITVNASHHADAVLKLPIPFPTKKLYANVTALFDGDFSTNRADNIVSVDNNLTSVRVTNSNGFNQGQQFKVYLFAIGY